MNWKSFFTHLAQGAITGALGVSGTILSGAKPGEKPNWQAVGWSAAVGSVLGALGTLASASGDQPIQSIAAGHVEAMQSAKP